MSRVAPLKDANGNELCVGDMIRHPDGTTARVAFDAARSGPSCWRAVYPDGESLWLGNQIGDKGQAVKVVEPCTVPPPGWRCTRAAGHDGPCAALPAAEGLRQAAEQFVAAHKDGNVAELADYFEDIFSEALGERPEMPTASTHGYVTVAQVEAAAKAQQEWDKRARAVRAARRLELMKHTPITLDDVRAKFWMGGEAGVNLLNDTNRQAFFRVWAIAACELADAMIEEAAK